MKNTLRKALASLVIAASVATAGAVAAPAPVAEAQTINFCYWTILPRGTFPRVVYVCTAGSGGGGGGGGGW